MSKRSRPLMFCAEPTKRRRLVEVDDLCDILNVQARTLPSTSYIANLLSNKNQLKLHNGFTKILNLPQKGQHSLTFRTIRSLRQRENTEHKPAPHTPILPVELWVQIFSYLTDTEKWNLAQTSKRYFGIFRHYVGFDSTIIFETELLPLQSLHDPEITDKVIETSSYTIQTINDLRIARNDPERYILHWRGSLTCLVLYHPNEPASPGAHRVWETYFEHAGIIIDNDQYTTTEIPRWCNTGQKILAIIPLTESDELLSRYRRYKLHEESKYLGMSFIFDPRKRTTTCQLRAYCKEVNKAIQCGENLLDNVKSCLLEMLLEETRERAISMNWNSATIKKLENYASAESPFVDIDLYQYQLQGLSWMKQIEENCQTTLYTFQQRVVAPVYPALNFYFTSKPTEVPLTDITNFKAITDKDTAHLPSDSFSTRGGIFADEMGMGKTITILALIASRKREKTQSGSYITTGRVSALFETGSTLVICPSHIVQQWKEEIQKHVPCLSVIDITMIQQLKEITYQQVLESDVVLISHQLLSNRNYMKKIGKLSTIHQRSMKNQNKIFPHSYYPVLQHFGWHRIVLDEGHEILSRPSGISNAFCPQEACGKELFDSFISNYRWYVSGTPLPNGRASLVGALNFLQLQITSGVILPEKLQADSPTIIYEYSLFNKVKAELFWRNTKKNSSKQIDIPNILEEIRLLELSPNEQAMYEAAKLENNYELMRQICNLPTMTAGENLPLCKMKAKMNYKYSQELGEAWETLLNYQSKLNELEKVLLSNLRFLVNFPPHLDEYQHIVEQINRKKISIESTKRAILSTEDKIVTLILQTSCFTRLSQGECSHCSSCSQELSSVYIKALCSHLFCSHCYEQTLIQTARCPLCLVYLKEPIGDKPCTVTQLLSRNNHESQQEMYFRELVNAYGTKIASLLIYVNDLLTVNAHSKIIIFSKYDPFLQYLGEALQHASECLRKAFVVCRGTVQARTKALDSFKELSSDAPSILLLSLTNAASGTHLTVATHIILVDPVTGNSETSDAYALARAHRIGQTKPVTAVRFVVQSTIDQEDFDSNFSDIYLNRCFPT